MSGIHRSETKKTLPPSNMYFVHTLRWRHNGLDSVPNHQPHDCLLNRSFGHRSKITSKLLVFQYSRWLDMNYEMLPYKLVCWQISYSHAFWQCVHRSNDTLRSLWVTATEPMVWGEEIIFHQCVLRKRCVVCFFVFALLLNYILSYI